MATIYPLRRWPVAAVGLGLGLFLTAETERLAWSGQEEQFTPEFRKLRTSFDAKHTPKIAAPESVKRGQWFDVTVNVGAGGEHPSLSEHAIRYIALYINTAEIARVYLHPVYSFPKVTFTIALDEGGTLRAIAEPNHSAGWEAAKKIAVAP
ncbi:MAG TPA: desulfoferrodoxin family protein [Terriglobales bacterium]|jgi:superoxide reductase|nr:desulfoferrodoxin family protein [Terriglobales bacterium]